MCRIMEKTFILDIKFTSVLGLHNAYSYFEFLPDLTLVHRWRTRI